MKKNKKVSKLQHNAKSEAKVKPQRESILQPTPIISCKKAAITLGISEHDLNQLISEHSVQIAKNYADLPSITKTDLKTISRSLKIDDMRAARFAQKKEYNNRLKQRITFAEMDERYSKISSRTFASSLLLKKYLAIKEYIKNDIESNLSKELADKLINDISISISSKDSQPSLNNSMVPNGKNTSNEDSTN